MSVIMEVIAFCVESTVKLTYAVCSSQTSKGDIVIDLHCDLCPITTKNFLKLCKVRAALFVDKRHRIKPYLLTGESVQQLHFLLLRQGFYHPDGRSDSNRQGRHLDLRDDVRRTGQILPGEARFSFLRTS